MIARVIMDIIAPAEHRALQYCVAPLLPRSLADTVADWCWLAVAS